MPTGKIPILLLDGDWMHTLRTIRALAQVGQWNIHVLATQKPLEIPIRFSRHVRSFHCKEVIEGSPDWIEIVLKRANEVGARIVFPQRESSSLNCIRHRTRIEQVVKLTPLADEQSFTTAIDKGSLAILMRKQGISHPRFCIVEGEEALHRLSSLNFPVLIKPRMGEFGKGIQRVDTREELLSSMNKFGDPSGWMIQEIVEGTDIDCSFLAIDGELIAWTIQRGLDVTNEKFSAPNKIEFVHNSRVLELSRKLAATLNYTGLAHVDMRQSSTGEVYVLELNARVWGSISGSVAAGVNFPDLSCRSAIGLTIPLTQQNLIRFNNGGSGIRNAISILLRLPNPTFRIGETHFPQMIRDPFPEILSLMGSILKNDSRNSKTQI
jgi:D-aspartate ligase